MNSIAARMVFENAKYAINKAFPINPDKPREEASELCKLTQSYLRLERELSINQSVYDFPVLVNNNQFGQQFNTEKRLNQNDSFVISEIGIFLGLPASETDAAFLPDSYPNPFIYGANATPLKGVYSGSLNITVNYDILVPEWDLLRHYLSPQTQQTAAAGAGSPVDEFDGKQYGFYPMEPNVVLIGSKKNDIKIGLPAPLTAVPANARLIMILRGVLAQNSTVVS